MILNKIVHRRQELPTSCGAASVAMLFGEKEETIRVDLKTNSRGTHVYEISNFLKTKGFIHSWIKINKNYFDCIDDLIKTSLQFPLILCGEYRSHYNICGRDRIRNHAILIADGKVYDPGENREMSGEGYVQTFNKKLVFNDLIIIEKERPNFLTNFKKYSDC